MSKTKTTLSPLRRKELASMKRQATKDVGKFVGIGPQPFLLNKPNLIREIERERMLVAYAVAIAVKRKLFTDDVEASTFYATVYDMVSNARVVFHKTEKNTFSIDVLNLDWSPAAPVLEQLAA